MSYFSTIQEEIVFNAKLESIIALYFFIYVFSYYYLIEIILLTTIPLHKGNYYLFMILMSLYYLSYSAWITLVDVNDYTLPEKIKLFYQLVVLGLFYFKFHYLIDKKEMYNSNLKTISNIIKFIKSAQDISN